MTTKHKATGIGVILISKFVIKITHAALSEIELGRLVVALDVVHLHWAIFKVNTGEMSHDLVLRLSSSLLDIVFMSSLGKTDESESGDNRFHVDFLFELLKLFICYISLNIARF